MLRLAVSVLMMILAAANVPAQQPEERKINPDLPNSNIKESYDRFSDLTSVVLDIRVLDDVVDLGGGSVYVPPTAAQTRTLLFTIIGVFEGKDFSKAIPRVALVITSGSGGWRYLRSPNLLQVIVNDSIRATMGDMRRVTSNVSPRGRGVVEQLRLDVSFDAVDTLSQADTLEMRIGEDEFQFKKEWLADLRQWVRKFPAAKTQAKPARKVK